MNEAPTGVTVRASILLATYEKPTMDSIATQISTINVPFYGDSLYLISKDNEPYVPMKPVVESMGLTWQSQHEKLKQRFNSTITEIVIVAGDGKSREMTCLAFRKFSAWLQTLSPNKVKPEIRDKVIQYQEECDDVLYEYWTKGQVTNPRKAKKGLPGKITVEQQEAIKQLVLNRGRSVPQEHQAKATITLWSALKTHFGCTYKDIEEDKFTEALFLAARVPLEGEFLGKESKTPNLNLLPINCEILARIENGVTVSTRLVPQSWYVGSLDDLLQVLERRGVVILHDEEEQRDFVKKRVLQHLN